MAGAGIIELAIALLLLTGAALSLFKVATVQQRDAQIALLRMRLAHIAHQMQAIGKLCHDCHCEGRVLAAKQQLGIDLPSYHFQLGRTSVASGKRDTKPKACILVQSARTGGFTVRLQSEII